MEFAIVRFVEENDAPGIVSSKWINEGKNICFFPNVRSEELKNKLLCAHAVPNSSWLQCPIRILQTYRTYKMARSHLRQAEDTSNLDSDEEVSKPRKRTKTARYMTETSSDEEMSQSLIHQKEAYPPPPITSSLTFSSPPVSFPISPIQSSLTFSSNEISSASPLPPVPFYSSPPLAPVINQNSFKSPATSACPPNSFPNTQNSLPNGLRHMLQDIIESNQRIESMLRDVLAQSKQQDASVQDGEDHFNFMSLPVPLENFEEFDANISKNMQFKKRLTNFCMKIGGRDPKFLISNLLRKLVGDDVGLKYSLTGRSTLAGILKLSFEMTECYKLILEICSRSYKDAKLNIIRESISDWLMQSKFRKNKREKRAEIKEKENASRM